MDMENWFHKNGKVKIMSNELTLEDISDLRAYERERPEFRSRVLALKKLRRIHVGEIMTFMFENKDTMRLQIQEMARVEKIVSDQKIEEEIKIYSELIPTSHELKATLLIELVNEDELREWLPKLISIQNHVHLVFGDLKVSAFEIGEDRLTREEEITTTVHYLNFTFTPEQKQAFMNSEVKVELVVDHPEYIRTSMLSREAIEQLQGDLAS